MKNTAVYIGIGIIRLISFLPLSIAQALGSLIGKVLWHTNSKTAKVVKINLALCFPDYDEKQLNDATKAALLALGKTYTEMGAVWMWPIKKASAVITEVEGLEHLQKALSDENGLIIIAPHHGNWELLNHFFHQYLTMTIMYKTAKLPAMDKFILNTRDRLNSNLVTADRKGVMALYKVLKKNGVIAVLPDQEPTKNSGVFAPFFGQPAFTGKLIGDLAKKTPAFLLSSFAMRLADGNYKVVLKPASEDIRHPDPVISATALNKSIEECILDCPEQYQWGYKRFRLQPEGRRSGFYK